MKTNLFSSCVAKTCNRLIWPEIWQKYFGRVLEVSRGQKVLKLSSQWHWTESTVTGRSEQHGSAAGWASRSVIQNTNRVLLRHPDLRSCVSHDPQETRARSEKRRLNARLHPAPGRKAEDWVCYVKPSLWGQKIWNHPPPRRDLTRIPLNSSLLGVKRDQKGHQRKTVMKSFRESAKRHVQRASDRGLQNNFYFSSWTHGDSRLTCH